MLNYRHQHDERLFLWCHASACNIVFKGVASMRQDEAIASSCFFFCKLESRLGLLSRSAPRVPDFIAHTPYAIQACLLTDRTAHKYHFFSFPQNVFVSGVTRVILFGSNVHQIVQRLWLPPDATGGAHSAPQTP